MIDPRPYADLCRHAYDHTDLVVGEAKALTASTADGFAVAFQGTHDARQALDDLDIRPRFLAGIGYVHHGFADLAEAVYPEVCRAVTEAGQPTILTGHSLGAAIALLVGAMMVRDKLSLLTAIIGFGPPRVSGGPAVSRMFSRAKLPVPLYRHGADEIPDLPPIFSPGAALIPIGTPSPGLDGVEVDHRIASYIAALDAAGGAL